MGINHRGFHVVMAEEFLDCPNVVAPFQKIRRKGMPKGVAGGTFGKVLLSTILALSGNAACFNNRTGIRKRIRFATLLLACNTLERTSTAIAQVEICTSYQVVMKIQYIGVGGRHGRSVTY